MVYITEDLIRRRAEHNGYEIISLEEISLHQQNIEKIEHIDKWCKELKIVYFQNNLIPKIENLGHLKKLNYLNLALNNIEVIENLEGCESLWTLDLTVNFVGCLSSVETLRNNLHLRKLFLSGNPCTEFQGYRQYVVATLPQLEELDGIKITRSERIKALQGLDELKRSISQQEQDYLRRRATEKEQEVQRKVASQEKGQSGRSSDSDEEQREREFWNTPCSFTPESRLEAYRHVEEKRKAEEKKTEKKQKPPRTLVTSSGQVLNINEPKLDFWLTEDEDNNTIILDLAVYRHMDTSLIDVDIQPTYARVCVKGKIFQLVLPAEVKPDSSTAQRSQATGSLVLTMPRAEGEIKVRKTITRPPASTPNRGSCISKQDVKRRCAVPEKLEVDPNSRTAVDFTNIVPRQSSAPDPLQHRPKKPLSTAMAEFSEDFIDDPEVPPLI
ncbi:dynein axonemal assembly factor 11 isoform X2 [Gouania willdenowi]|uniref:dynein axonemal assembly factor 11 isoform X1 n=1 Tax=Gouania willdenowi TaxID=441366 RepID=UPI001055FEB3|nr:protein tilB homolog isoform X1 [Gouania willdenowi]XP_028328443.1 protein tilB homolog isoform X2 [Gouania willdenowi]